MRTLLIDNHDSYTYNLFQLLAEAYGVAPHVVTNDAPEWSGLDLGAFDAVVVSPGPGRPQVGRDVGACLDVLRTAALPVLGVCLGHQAIGWLAGADVVPAPAPRHGHLERVRHAGRDLFAGLPQGFTAVRYHSLCVAEPLPPDLEALAWAADGVVMALRHRRRPWWGVQFHPESVATEHGRRLVENFGRLVAGPATARRRREPTMATATTAVTPPAPAAGGAPPATAVPRAAAAARRWTVRSRRVGRAVDAGAAFERLFAGRRHAFWLDSSRVEPGRSRFSFAGDAGGAHGEVLTYRVGTGAVEVETATAGTDLVTGSIFDVLEARLAERRVEPRPDLPFDLAGGYVGYLGYELKADCGSPNRHVSPAPDAVWVAATRLVAVDHHHGQTWVAALCPEGEEADAERWLAWAETRVRALPGAREVPAVVGTGGPDPEPWLARDRATYLGDVAECQRQLHAGETYEICLTNTADVPFSGEPLGLYRRLRRVNPAPYGAFLRLAGTAVLCSSPERFLHVEPGGTVESRPIKGTAARHPHPGVDAALRRELAASPKARAENLMIVDLVRNDLGRVCEVGTVSVPGFLDVESYATVHQLVSTVRGRLRAGTSPVAAARACFPGGSMTGAPKLRTMEILDRLETRARGVYSGAIGYFGPGGSADLSIAIRCAVSRGGRLEVGAGGAIVLASDPEAEYREMLLKAQASLRALDAAPPPEPAARRRRVPSVPGR